jgi:hypothetical protein
MKARHLPAKKAQATLAAWTTETVMLPSEAALRLKFGACEDDAPPKIRIAPPRERGEHGRLDRERHSPRHHAADQRNRRECPGLF